MIILYRGSAGHEVISGAIAIKKELEDLKRLDRYEDRLKAKQSKSHDPETLNLQSLTRYRKRPCLSCGNDVIVDECIEISTFQ